MKLSKNSNEKIRTILLTIAVTLAVETTIVCILCGSGIIHIGLGKAPEKKEIVISASDTAPSGNAVSDIESDIESGSTTAADNKTTAKNNKTTANNGNTTSKTASQSTQPTTQKTTQKTTQPTTQKTTQPTGDNYGDWVDEW